MSDFAINQRFRCTSPAAIHRLKKYMNLKPTPKELAKPAPERPKLSTQPTPTQLELF